MKRKRQRERDDEKREREELDDRDDTVILKENQKDIIKQKGQQDRKWRETTITFWRILLIEVIHSCVISVVSSLFNALRLSVETVNYQ